MQELEIWDLILIKDKNTIQLQYYDLDYNIEIDTKHQIITFTKKTYPKRIK